MCAIWTGKIVCAEAGGVEEAQKKGMDEFRSAYKKKFGIDVQLYAPYVYDAVMVMVEAMKKADSADPAKYLPLVYTRFEGTECMNYSPLIYAFEQQNIAVTGRGTLDGSASDENWWRWARRPPGGGDAPSRADVVRLREMGARGVMSAESHLQQPGGQGRPRPERLVLLEVRGDTCSSLNRCPGPPTKAARSGSPGSVP